MTNLILKWSIINPTMASKRQHIPSRRLSTAFSRYRLLAEDCKICLRILCLLILKLHGKNNLITQISEVSGSNMVLKIKCFLNQSKLSNFNEPAAK